MLSSSTLRRVRRHLGRIVPVLGVLGWLYGLPGFITDGRWWWQSTSRAGLAVAVGVVSLLTLSSIMAAASGNVPNRLRRVVRRLVVRFG